MDNPFVTIARFNTPIEAHMAKSLLEAEGIDAIVADEHMGDAAGGYIQAMGGIRLQVQASDAEDAQAIIGQQHAQPSNAKPSTRLIAGILAVLMVIALIGAWIVELLR